MDYWTSYNRKGLEGMRQKTCKCGRDYIPGLNGTSEKCDWCCSIAKGEDLAVILNLAKVLEISNNKKVFN